jgi:hypothetical protein
VDSNVSKAKDCVKKVMGSQQANSELKMYSEDETSILMHNSQYLIPMLVQTLFALSMKYIL